jgi:transcriptional regulator with PAS, ATPase and Fis domain
VALNCAALSEPLLEAELFGYEPGAFTGGAPGGHAGLLAAAEGGTLFLDEVGELALGLQAKLLRVLQERAYRRVGANRDISIDLRIVAASNRDLAALVEERRFREDLFYRLNVMSLTVPPLRARREDIPELAVHFLRRFGEEFGKSFQGFSEAAMQRLVAAPWPGNVRELRNAVERAALLSGEPLVRPEHLALEPAPGSAPAAAPGEALLLPPGERSLAAAEEALIRRVLLETGGNRSRSARLLGINRTTLYHKLRLYGIAAETQ